MFYFSGLEAQSEINQLLTQKGEKTMHKNQRVSDMASEVLARQAQSHTGQTGRTLQEALKAILDIEAGRKLLELRDGPHHEDLAQQWQEDLAQKRYEERRRARQEKRRRARQEERREVQLAAWKSFVQSEMRELEMRKNGQLARLLGEPLPGEASEALQRLTDEDRRQAEEELVALIRNGNVIYKYKEELTEDDMPARVAANRLRTTWLKERLDGWLADGEALS